MRSLLTWMLVAICGWLSVWAPWMLAGSQKNMIDGMRPISLLLLAALGLFGRARLPLKSWQVALGSVTAFPVFAAFDAAMHAGTHNLLGIELIMYVFLCIPTLVGAVIAKVLLKSRAKL